MANPNSQNVSVGKPSAAGGIFSAPLESDTPNDATSALTDFVGLGYVSDEGLVNATERDVENITAWGGNTVASVQTTFNETFAFTFIETNEQVLAEVYGQDNVDTVDGTITVLHTSNDLPTRQYVFEILLTGNRVKRIVVPRGKITEVGEVQYVDGEPIGYSVTISTSPDSAGVTAYEYIASVVVTPAP